MNAEAQPAKPPASLEERVSSLERLLIALIERDQRPPTWEEQHREFCERIRRSQPEW